MSKQNLSLNLFSLILLMVFFVLPFSTISNFLKYQSKVFFNIFQASSTNLLDIGILFFLIILFISSLFCLFILLKFSKTLTSILIYPLVFVCIWIFISGFFFPLSSLTGIIDPASAGVNKKNLIIVVLLSIIFSILLILYEKKLNFFIYFLYLFLFINFITFSFSFVTKKEEIQIETSQFKNIDNQNIFLESTKLNPKNNIIVISFDGISSVMLEDIFFNNNNYNNIFKDFEFFSNIFSQAPATTLSIAGELYGNLDFRKISLEENVLVKKLNKMQNIFDNQNDYYTFGDYNTFNKKVDYSIFNYINNLDVNETLKNIKLKEINLEIYRYSSSRYGTRILVNYLDDIKFYFYKKYYAINFKKLNLNEKVFFHRGASFEKKTLTDIQILKDYINKLSVDMSKKTKVSLRMFHFNFTHFPVDFDDKCNYLSYDKKKFNSIQDYNGLKRETLCSIKLMENFIQKLKDINLYNNSTIIFKSDHGVPSNYFINSKHSKINYKINNHKQFGYLRYKPFLMIKKKDQNQFELKYNDEFRSLNSLNGFYCKLLNEKKCIDINKVQIFIPQKKSSSFFIKDLNKISISSKDELLKIIFSLK